MFEFFNTHKPKKTNKPIIKTQKAKTHEIRKYDSEGKFIKSYSSVSEAAEKEGLSIGGISKVLYGERKTAGGFQWKRCAVESPKMRIDAINR